MCNKHIYFLSKILVLAQKNKKWLNMWSAFLSFKAGMTGNIFNLAKKKKKLLTTWGLNGRKKKSVTISPCTMAQNWHGNLQPTFSPQFAFQEWGWAFMGLAWKQKPLRPAARAEIISLMVCGGVHGPGEGLTWLENFERRHSWLAELIAWPALMLRAMPDRWDVAVKCASVPPATLCARPSALTYELLLRFNDVCVKFVGGR